MRREKSCGAVVFTRLHGEIRYLLAQSRAGIYGFPKGHVEENETEQETALREIYEEVHIRPSFLDGFRMTEEYPLPKKGNILKEAVYFLAEYQDQSVRIQKEELMEARLVSYEEAMTLLQHEGRRRILQEAHRFLCR